MMERGEGKCWMLVARSLRLVAFLCFCGARRPEAERLQESENKVIKVDESRGRYLKAAVAIC